MDYAYSKPYYRGDDGFRPLSSAHDAAPGAITISSISTGIPSVAIDDAGQVFRYFSRDGGPTTYWLTGRVEERVLRRVLSLRTEAAKSATTSLVPPYCPDASGGGRILLIGLEPPLDSTVLATAGIVSATRRRSKAADVLTRWTLSIHGRALGVPPVCIVNKAGTDCIPTEQ